MNYEPRFERFLAEDRSGRRQEVEFVRAGFLASGDFPEIYFFRLGGQEAAVAISGDALKRFEKGRRRLSREEKIDLTGLWLKQKIGAGVALDGGNLLMRDAELNATAAELGIPR